MQIVGDDLFVTNVDRLRQGVQHGAANALLFKVNQIGTLSEALDAAEFAYRHQYGVQVSERSGETEDPIISDLVVALNSGQIKTGMPIRGSELQSTTGCCRLKKSLEKQRPMQGEILPDHLKNQALMRISYIKNRHQLLSHGNIELRKAALEIIEHALAKVDPYSAVYNLVQIENDTLSVGDLQFDLTAGQRIFVLGGGKATYPIAQALEEILAAELRTGWLSANTVRMGNCPGPDYFMPVIRSPMRPDLRRPGKHSLSRTIPARATLSSAVLPGAVPR